MGAQNETAGIALAKSGDRWWAWYGVRVTAATDLSQLAEYRHLERGALLRALVDADRAYLAAQLGTDSALELRWTSASDQGLVRVDVLGRLSARSSDEAIQYARRARSRLGAVPSHVTARELTATDELMSVLSPRLLSAGSVAELRKRWIVERRQRPDAPPYYVSTPWLREVPAATWSALIRTLAAAPQETVLTIGLQPVDIPPELRSTISARTAKYRMLAEPGQRQVSGLYSDPVPLSTDPGAVTAGQLFEDAGQRYQDRAFKLRISLASDGPLPASLLTQVREAMSPAESADERGFRSAALAGTALDVVFPTQRADVGEICDNVATLAHHPWGTPQLPPEAMTEVQELQPLGEIVDLREATSVFRFPSAPDGTLDGFPVVRPRDGVRVSQDGAAASHLLLGHQALGGGSRPVTVPLASLSSHALVVGSTGSGKTSSVLNLLEQLWGQHRIPFLVIEPVNADRDDYRWLLERPGFDDLLVLTVGDESLAPFRLNPFEVPSGVRIGSHLASLVACFDAAFGLTGPLPFLYRKALKAMYTRVGISPDEVASHRHVGRWPRLKDLAEVFATLPDIDRYAGQVKSNIQAASRLRTESLLTGSCGRTLDAVSSYPVAELLRRPVVLELAAVGDDDREQALVIALLLNSLTAYYKASRLTSTLAHVTVIEEAHRLLRRPRPTSGEGGEQSGRAAEQFANTLAENRKYGEGLIIVEQVPSKLIEDAHKNTALKVMHHLPASDDREVLAAAMNLSADQLIHAQALENMTAYVTHRGLGGRAGLVDVPNVRGDAARARGVTEDPLPGRDVVRHHFEGFVRSQPGIWEDLAPYLECAGCRFRCQFRGIGEVTAPRSAPSVKSSLSKNGYPTAPTDVERLWADLVHRHRALADTYEEFSELQRDDLAACMFMHATFAAFPGRRMQPMVKRFRATAASTGDA